MTRKTGKSNGQPPGKERDCTVCKNRETSVDPGIEAIVQTSDDDGNIDKLGAKRFFEDEYSEETTLREFEVHMKEHLVTTPDGEFAFLMR